MGAAGGAGSEGGATLASRVAGIVSFTLSSHCTEGRGVMENCPNTSLFETRHTRLGNLQQWLKCLPDKHKDPISIPRSHTQLDAALQVFVILALP